MNDDGSVSVYQLTHDKEKMTVKQFLRWNNGEVERINKRGRGMNVTYVIPPSRDRGVFLSRDNRLLIALRA